MKASAIATKATLSFCALGAILHAYEAARAVADQPDGGSDFGGFMFLGGLLLWSCLPYAIWVYVAAVKGQPAPAVGGALGTLSFDLWVHYSVFIGPTSSTTALALLFAPVWNLILFGPLGAAIAWPVITLLARRKNAP
jgi:hypothetical protein